MVEWLAANWLPLIVFIVVVIGLVWFILKKRGLRQAAIDAIVYVQEKMRTEEGKVKMQGAIDYIQQLVPFLAFVPDSLIETFIQSVFDQIESALKLPTMECNVEVIEECKTEDKEIENKENEPEG